MKNLLNIYEFELLEMNTLSIDVLTEPPEYYLLGLDRDGLDYELIEYIQNRIGELR